VNVLFISFDQGIIRPDPKFRQPIYPVPFFNDSGRIDPVYGSNLDNDCPDVIIDR